MRILKPRPAAAGSGAFLLEYIWVRISVNDFLILFSDLNNEIHYLIDTGMLW